MPETRILYSYARSPSRLPGFFMPGAMARSSSTRRGNGPGHGGPKAGAGWGGPAKGHAPRPLAPAGDEYSDSVRAKAHDLDILANAEQVKAQMRAVLYQIAMAGEAEAARMNAADKLLDRLEGKAVVKQDIRLRSIDPDTMTDEELAAIVARGRSGGAADEAGD